MDLDALTPAQHAAVGELVQQSVARGINPDLTVAMCKAENSSFDPNLVNPKKVNGEQATGLCQVLPSVGKSLGYTDMTDPKQNVSAMLDLVQERMKDPRIGTDPEKIVATYNAGYKGAEKYLNSNNPADLPQETLKHLANVAQNSYDITGQDELPLPRYFGPGSPEKEPIPQNSPDNLSNGRTEPPPITQPAAPGMAPVPFSTMPADQAIATAGIGAGVGAGAKGAMMLGHGALHAVGNAIGNPIADAIERRAAALSAASPATNSAAGTISGPAGAARSPVIVQPNGGGISPTGGSATANYGKAFGLSDFDAQRAVDMSKGSGGVWDLKKTVPAAEDTLRGMGINSVVESAPGSKVLLPNSVGSGPRGAANSIGALLSAQAAPAAQEAPGWLSSLGSKASGALSAVSKWPLVTGTAKLAGGALSGAGALLSAQEALNKYHEGDTLGAGLSGLSSAAGLLSLTPWMPVAAPVAVGAGALSALRDKYTRDPDFRSLYDEFQSNLQNSGAAGP